MSKDRDRRRGGPKGVRRFALGRIAVADWNGILPAKVTSARCPFWACEIGSERLPNAPGAGPPRSFPSCFGDGCAEVTPDRRAPCHMGIAATMHRFAAYPSAVVLHWTAAYVTFENQICRGLL